MQTDKIRNADFAVREVYPYLRVGQKLSNIYNNKDTDFPNDDMADYQVDVLSHSFQHIGNSDARKKQAREAIKKGVLDYENTKKSSGFYADEMNVVVGETLLKKNLIWARSEAKPTPYEEKNQFAKDFPNRVPVPQKIDGYKPQKSLIKNHYGETYISDTGSVVRARNPEDARGSFSEGSKIRKAKSKDDVLRQFMKRADDDAQRTSYNYVYEDYDDNKREVFRYLETGYHVANFNNDPSHEAIYPDTSLEQANLLVATGKVWPQDAERVKKAIEKGYERYDSQKPTIGSYNGDRNIKVIEVLDEFKLLK